MNSFRPARGRPPRPDGPDRRGHLIFEAGLSALVLGIAMTVLVPMLATAARSKRHAWQAVVAREQAANLLDRFVARPRSEWPSIAEAAARPDAEPAALLPEGRYEVRRDPVAGDVPGERVTVSVHWTTGAGQAERSVSLTGFRFGEEGRP